MNIVIRDLSDSHNFPDRILDIIPANTTPLFKIDTLNNLASKLKEIGNQYMQYFEKLMDYVNPQTIDEVLVLAESMYEFELYDGIKDVEGYGRYMICESGYFEYDSNLREYIDFKRYGQEKMMSIYLWIYRQNYKLEKVLGMNDGQRF